MITVSVDDFDMAKEYAALRDAAKGDGAIVTFVGLVRDWSEQKHISAMFLEHYPGMTEKSLQQIIEQAQSRWQLGQVRIVHRVGELRADDQIVFVGTTSRHRQDAFDGARFIMDKLKTEAPFWKKERHSHGESWVEAKSSDQVAADAWEADT